jgi:hypothetical protein
MREISFPFLERSRHREPFLCQSRGFAPRTPLHALSRAASPARSVRVAHSLRSFAFGIRHSAFSIRRYVSAP